jgi:hypothetical protein
VARGISDVARDAALAAQDAYYAAARAVPPLVAKADTLWSAYEAKANAARSAIQDASIAGAPYPPATLTTPAAKDVPDILEQDREKWAHGRSDPVWSPP